MLPQEWRIKWKRKWKMKWKLGIYGGLWGIGGFLKLGVPFWGPNNKDCSILGSILGSPYFGKLPYDRSASGLPPLLPGP